MKFGFVVLVLILLLSFSYFLAVVPYYLSTIVLILIFLGILSIYVLNLYVKTKDITFVLFIFLIGGIAAQTRNFTYIRIGPVFITEMIMFLLLISTLGKFAIKREYNVFAGRNVNILAKLFIIYLSGGLIYLIHDLLSLREVELLECLRNFSLVYYSIFSFLVYHLFKKSPFEKLEKFFLTILLMNTARSAAVIAMYVLGLETFIPQDGGILGGPASLISAFSSLIAFHYLALSYGGKKLLYTLLFVANVLFTLLSGHRSAYLALGIALFIYLFLSGGIKVAISAVPLLLLISLLDLSSVPLFGEAIIRIYYNVESLLYGKLSDPNVDWRYRYWNNVVEEVIAKPWGLGFDYSLSKLAPWEVWAERPTEIEFRSSVRLDPHNSYIAILARLGLWGFIIFLLILIFYLKLTFKILKNSTGENRNYALLSFVCFTAVAVFASFNVTLEGPYHGIFYWIFIGINMALYTNIVANTR